MNSKRDPAVFSAAQVTHAELAKTAAAKVTHTGLSNR
jgi:hypothetical protein